MGRRPHAVPCLIAAAFLFAALAHWPYGYYTLLRWVTCASAAYVALNAHTWKRLAWVWPFAFIALLFNPLVPVHLSREVWQPINLATAAMFVAAVLLPLAPRQSQASRRSPAAVLDE